jgi:hypothetical protein
MNELEMMGHVFGIMKQYVSEDDIYDAADEIVGHLMDAGYSADDVREYAGQDHPELQSALDAYGEYEAGGEDRGMDDEEYSDEE